MTKKVVVSQAWVIYRVCQHGWDLGDIESVDRPDFVILRLIRFIRSNDQKILEDPEMEPKVSGAVARMDQGVHQRSRLTLQVKTEDFAFINISCKDSITIDQNVVAKISASSHCGRWIINGRQHDWRPTADIKDI